MTTTQLFIVAIAILNVISFIMVYADKRKSINNSERLPEVSFFVQAIFFSALGVLVGMFAFHHKTQKLSFVFGIGLLLIQQIALAYFVIQTLLN